MEAERAFSAMGLFVTEIRSKLNESTIDNLGLLRSYLLRQKKSCIFFHAQFSELSKAHIELDSLVETHAQTRC